MEPLHQPKGASMSSVVTIGLDLAKSIFQIHGVDDAGRPMLRRRLSRHELVSYLRQALALPNRDGGLFCCAPLGTRTLSRRPFRSVDPAAIRQAVCEEEQDRCCRCRGDLRSRRPGRTCALSRSRRSISKALLSLHRVRSLVRSPTHRRDQYGARTADGIRHRRG